jgi:hypothetical protein
MISRATMSLTPEVIKLDGGPNWTVRFGSADIDRQFWNVR